MGNSTWASFLTILRPPSCLPINITLLLVPVTTQLPIRTRPRPFHTPWLPGLRSLARLHLTTTSPACPSLHRLAMCQLGTTARATLVPPMVRTLRRVHGQLLGSTSTSL